MDESKINFVPSFGENKSSSSAKKYVLVLIVVIVLAVAIFAYVKKDWMFSFIKKEQPVVVLPPAPKYIKTDLPTNKLPEILPKDLPVEKGIVILENYQAETENGKVQGTRKFLSQKNVKENYAVYRNYLFNNKWKILELKNESNSINIMATKSDTQDKFFADFYVSPIFPKSTTVVITFSSVKK